MMTHGLARFCIGLAFATHAIGVPGADIELGPGQAGEPVVVAKGDVLVVHVEGNASTGYRWERIDEGDGVLVQVRGAASPAPRTERPVIGGPTRQSWRFRVDAPGESTLRLVYRQPWRKDVAPARELVWRIVVR